MRHAATRTNLLVSSQARSYRDAPKRFAAQQKCESKLMGTFDAGLGLNMHVGPMWMTGGANLMLTSLHLSLSTHAESERPLGLNPHLT
jgi:hypothetical protein